MGRGGVNSPSSGGTTDNLGVGVDISIARLAVDAATIGEPNITATATPDNTDTGTHAALVFVRPFTFGIAGPGGC
jgi:hypothetical protein